MSAPDSFVKPVWDGYFPRKEVGCLSLNIAIVAGSFLLGITLIYGVSGLRLSNHPAFKLLGAPCLAVSLIFAIIYGVRYYYKKAIAALAFGLGLLLLTIMLGFMTISSTLIVCHLSIAKLLILLFGIAGSVMSCYGALRLLETRQEATLTKIDEDSVKVLILILAAFFAVYVIVTEFVVLSISQPCLGG